MRILMFGRSGQVATELARRTALTALGRDQADLTDPAACATAIAALPCDIVINAAAHTGVDKAETEEGLATTINAAAPGAMAAACRAKGVPFLHISTDYVFDGSGQTPWVEDAPTGPLGAYGRSKLAGERAVAAATPDHVILRTSWVHAAHGANFVRTMLRLGGRAELKVVDDQRGGPTAAGDIAEALLAIARAWAAGQGAPGVFHFSGAPAVTWHGFATEIFAQAPWAGAPVITPIPSADYPTPAARPGNSVLDCAKLERVYGLAQPDWRASLRPILAELKG